MRRVSTSIVHHNCYLLERIPDRRFWTCSHWWRQAWKMSEMNKISSFWEVWTVKTLMQERRINNSPFKKVSRAGTVSILTLMAEIKPVVLVINEFGYRENFETNGVFLFCSNETETCKQVESPGVNGNHKDVSKEDARAGSSKFGFGFSSMRGEKVDRRRAAHDLRMQMKDLQFRLRELGTTGGSDSDKSIFAEPLGVRQRKTKAVYEKSPIKPEKFPGKNFNRWELWVKYYKSVAKANGWTGQQDIAALPACLTSWAVEEFDTVPRNYIEKITGEEAPIFETLLEVIKPKMQQYRSRRATRSEFKSVRQKKTSPWKSTLDASVT